MSDFFSSQLQTGNIYKLIFESSPEAIVVLDVQGNLILANDRIYDWLEYEVKNLIGLNFLKLPFLTPDAKEIIKKNFQERIMGKILKPYQVNFQEKNGRHRAGLIDATPILDENGKIVGDLVFIFDTTKTS